MNKAKLAAIIAALLLAQPTTAPVYTTENIVYPMSGQVVTINAEDDTVTIESRNGNLWEFCGIEDWQVGDYCACLMDNNGTEIIYDDIIRSVRYEGR